MTSMMERTPAQKLSCSVVGARGYSGLETVRLLLGHPHAELKNCFATGAFEISNYLTHPKLADVKCASDSEIFNELTDVYFLATPGEVSLKLAPKLIAAGKIVIDLSGAFRLKKHSYQQWYGFEHTERALLSVANYGLLPWAGPLISSSGLIANPGCYATAISLALIPLLKDGLVSPRGIVIDAKSGSSGAGKKATENLLFTEVEGECLPYKVGEHQHFPEILETLEAFSGKLIDAHFSTSLLPIRRGIIASIFAELCDGVGIDDINSSFQEAYANEPLIIHSAIAKNRQLLSLKRVVGTARTHISYEVRGSKLYLFSCIDNLLKGAAAQAIENFNRVGNLPTFTGLNQLENMI